MKPTQKPFMHLLMSCSVKNSNAVYESMKKMMEDSSLRTYFQKNARPMIVSRYEQEVVWKAILAEYKKLEKNV